MPVPNSPQNGWSSYLIEDFSGQGNKFLDVLEKTISIQQLPQVTMSRQKVNMWFRPNSPCLDVTSQLDGSSLCTIHVMDYGKSLFIGAAFFPSLSAYPNYYKRMAAVAFMETINRCVVKSVNEVAQSIAKENLEIKIIDKS